MRYVPGLLLFALTASMSVQVDGQTDAGRVPVPLTAEQDHKRMMDLLKISGFPPGAVASSPDTYDEALANPYPNLPDPLTFKSGQKVTTARHVAKAARRNPRGLRARSLRTTAAAHSCCELAGREDDNWKPTAMWRRLRSNCSAASTTPRYPAISVNVQAILTLPADARGPVPVIIQFGGGAFELPAGVPASTNLCQVAWRSPRRGAGSSGYCSRRRDAEARRRNRRGSSRSFRADGDTRT